MADFGFIFRGGRLEMRVEHRGVGRYVPTHYDVREEEWDAAAGWTILLAGNTSRRRKLVKYQRSMSRDLRLMGRIVRDFEAVRGTADDMANAYRAAMLGNQILGIYASTLADELKHRGQPRTARGYISTVRRFIDFNRGDDIRLDNLSTSVVDAFEAALRAEELTLNTLSFYMRTLRAIYNKAVAENILSRPLHDPFENAYIHIETPRTVRKTVPV
jgi:hypothetical protein